MDKHRHSIQSYCLIRDRTITVNGQRYLDVEPTAALLDFLKTAYRQLDIDYPKFHKMDGLSKAIFIAVELIARESGPYNDDTALVFSNYSSSYLADSRHAMDIFNGTHPMASPATFVYTLPNIAMGEISIRHQLHSENVFFIFDSYLPEFLVPYGTAMLDDGKTSGILSGWTEVTDTRCDVFLYHIGKTGGMPHTIEHLKRLYQG
ncbi:hypothetical protein [Parapedobacter koreensis]|uniref:Beta-ketoacyl synthase, N-terminal domain n=1 Tax=Parapedobacter koreensis TaxID=332977 RepID=A0A1H7S934_9SPHI|nr:hypothetical protein [Parapedobacter koreensis]SEL68993.1 hypothetical protein SAMN05421740_108159 [Parapedobacter koreensis]